MKLVQILRSFVALVVAMAPSLALAQTAQTANDGFVKVEGRPVETIAANPYIGGAYGFIWAAVLVYVIFVARGLSKANADLDDLRRRLDRKG